ncbi:NADH-ubiquinone dehydrogenase [Borborobacter arsenicus]|nr:NADH-ubiquinone dehydrogenase [Pseudaminobacter arsenicus]
MNQELAFTLRDDFAGAINLMVHPVASAAACSALGLGMASHAMGVWMGAVAGAAHATQSFFVSQDDEAMEDVDAFVPKEKSATTQARAVAKTLMADVRSMVRDVSEATAGLTGAEKPGVKARQPLALARPATPDDLKRISGIGPKLEQVLNGLGVWTYEQVIAWDEAEIAWVEDYLSFKGRIGRDGWAAQATRLVAEKTTH